jgi:galactokinase/mevalonate kinase-like predicted kinase
VADAVAHARAALAGNPSDGYGGAVLAFAFEELRAHASATRAPALSIEPDTPLVRATVKRFARDYEPGALSSEIRWNTTIPRGVGLAGSSAIIIATLRALCELRGVRLGPRALAESALAIETEDLGIAAGLQDRLAQAHGGLLFMDFGHDRHEPLDAGALPPLLIAWRADAAKDSDRVHAPLRTRFERGEAAVIGCMTELAELARTARRALSEGDLDELAKCVDGSFDARRRVLALDPRHVEMIETARRCGAAANYTGSGGAVVCVCSDAGQRDEVKSALARIGADTLVPTVSA